MNQYRRFHVIQYKGICAGVVIARENVVGNTIHHMAMKLFAILICFDLNCKMETVSIIACVIVFEIDMKNIETVIIKLIADIFYCCIFGFHNMGCSLFIFYCWARTAAST